MNGVTNDSDAPRGEPNAIVRPDLAEPILDLSRRKPRESLSAYVDYLWLVRWTVVQPHSQQVLPQPKVHLAAEDGRLLVHGVNREPFARHFTTSGQAIGVAFRPGGFRPFLRSAVGALEGRVVPAGDLWPHPDEDVARYVLRAGNNDDMVRATEDYLELLSPEPDPVVDEVAEIVRNIEQNTSIHRVDQVAALTGMSPRSLQRLFNDYVGIAPKWVIQRRRLLDAAEWAHAGTPVHWAELADRLGFSDQAHLIRAFTAAVGTPPATYARETQGRRRRG